MEIYCKTYFKGLIKSARLMTAAVKWESLKLTTVIGNSKHIEDCGVNLM